MQDKIHLSNDIVLLYYLYAKGIIFFTLNTFIENLFWEWQVSNFWESRVTLRPRVFQNENARFVYVQIGVVYSFLLSSYFGGKGEGGEGRRKKNGRGGGGKEEERWGKQCAVRGRKGKREEGRGGGAETEGGAGKE